MTMASNDDQSNNDDMMDSRKALYEGFLKTSTYSIVGVAVLLIGMALFLL